VPPVSVAWDPARQSSLMAVVRKSKEPNLMLLLGVKVSTSTDADKLAIGVKKVAWHACSPLPGALTIVVSEIGGTIDLLYAHAIVPDGSRRTCSR
jgi:hypothetical protein